MSSLTTQSVNPALLKVQYAVRGEIAIKADQYRDQLKKPNHGLPFNRVITANIGNPQVQGLDQKPLTFTRQVAALTEYIPLMETEGIFPKDAIARARELYAEIGSIGAYSHSQGVPFIRKNVADFIAKRDGYPSDPSTIFLTAGASAGVSLLINMLINTPKAGILIPIPQYPLYTASLAQHKGVPIPYYLDETAEGWSTSSDEVERAVQAALKDGIEPKALVVINPGNPVGSVVNDTVMKELLKVCEKHKLVLLADEVYQANLHDPATHPWTSFKKILRDTQSPVSLISFHSISKGVSGECGRRGGYFECANVSKDVLDLIYKMASVGLCPPVSGQIGVDSLVRPPKEGDESYPLWKEETDAIHKALAERTHVMAKRINSLPGLSCAPSPGALYLFPQLHLPEGALRAAKEAGKSPDGFYAHALLDQTGICAVPGDGFGQKEGEAHFRLTCLCAGVDEYVDTLEKFQKEFMEKYSQ